MLAWLLAILALTGAPASAPAASNQGSIVEADGSLMQNPSATLARLRLLGVQQVRLSLYWSYVAPHATSSRAPRSFDASDPGSYPAANWAIWDTIIRDAASEGIAIDLDPQGGTPRWAMGPGEPRGATNVDWEPSPAAYREFMHAVGERYSGNYDPATGRLAPGDPNDLPRD